MRSSTAPTAREPVDDGERPLRVLMALTYHRPYVSGPIVYAERLARGLTGRGHHVTILTSQYDRSLALHDHVDGVEIVRVPVAARISKGVVMPTHPAVAWRLVGEHDAVVIHVPQFEAPVIATIARMRGVPSLMTYHCDLQLPPGPFNALVDRVVAAGNAATSRVADRTIAYTDDYAEHTPLLRRRRDRLTVIPPPTDVSDDADGVGFRTRHHLGDGPIVGICARFAAEKGFGVLLDAVETLDARGTPVTVVHAGETDGVIGEDAERRRLLPRIRALGLRYREVGVLGGDELAGFFTACDVTVLPSLNRTESFGLVQVESMLCGTPVVAADLPGVRVPTRTTGMGLTVPPGDAEALADAIGRVLADPTRFHRPRAEIERHFSTDRTVTGYLHEIRGATVHSADHAERLDVVWRHRRDLPWFRALIRACESPLYERAFPPVSRADDRPVLDLGSGDGHFGTVVSEHRRDRIDVGVDRDPASLREARATGTYRSLTCADATSLPFPDHTFGAVMSNCVIEHLPDLDAALGEIHRVLRPGGRLVATVPTPLHERSIGGAVLARRLGLRHAAARYQRWFARLQEHHHVHDVEGWRSRLEAAGFEVEHAAGYLPPDGLRWFDLGHVAGVPNLVWYRLTGRWVAWRWRPRFAFGLHLAAPHVRLGDDRLAAGDGTGLFLIARRSAGGEGPQSARQTNDVDEHADGVHG